MSIRTVNRLFGLCGNCYVYGYPCTNCDDGDLHPCDVHYDEIKEHIVRAPNTYEEFLAEEKDCQIARTSVHRKKFWMCTRCYDEWLYYRQKD